MAICPAENWYAVFDEVHEIPVAFWSETTGMVSMMDLRKFNDEPQPFNWPPNNTMYIEAPDEIPLISPHYFSTFTGYRKHE